MLEQSTFLHSYNILYKDMKHIAYYICSCACFYPKKDDVRSNQCEHRQSAETMIHFAQEKQAKTQSYNTTTELKDEVQHHTSPIETTEECKNPMHSVITLPPAPLVTNISGTDSSPPSSSDDEDTIRINVSEVEDFSVASSSKKEDPWHVL